MGAHVLSPLVLACPLFLAKVWYDNRADDLTKEGMLKGIEEASAFVLFLSTGVLQRPYCQMEIRHAMALKKPIVLLHGESNARMPGLFDYFACSLRPAQRATLATDPSTSAPRTTRRQMQMTCESCSTITSPW